MAREKFILMSELTEEQKQRISYAEDPIRKIMLWGKDSEKNNCLLILYGIQTYESIHIMQYFTAKKSIYLLFPIHIII